MLLLLFVCVSTGCSRHPRRRTRICKREYTCTVSETDTQHADPAHRQTRKTEKQTNTQRRRQTNQTYRLTQTLSLSPPPPPPLSLSLLSSTLPLSVSSNHLVEFLPEVEHRTQFRGPHLFVEATCLSVRPLQGTQLRDDLEDREVI